jgi:hypothetical protein
MIRVRPDAGRLLVRRVLQVATVVIGVLLAGLSWRFVEEYLHDPVLVNQSGYLGTLLGVASAEVMLVQYVRSLGRTPSSDEVRERLRDGLSRSLTMRLDRLRMADHEIPLQLVDSNRAVVELAGIYDDAFGHRRSRLVIVGNPGTGKSYTCLRLALEIMSAERDTIPLLVPLSRWDAPDDLDDWFARFLSVEYRLSYDTALALVLRGEVVPILDGLDELVTEPSDNAVVEDFLHRLLAWTTEGGPARLALSVRSSTWSQLPQSLRQDVSLRVLTIAPVRTEVAERYLDRALLRIGPDIGRAIVDRFTRDGHDEVLTRAWRLALLAEAARDRSQGLALPEAEMEDISRRSTDDAWLVQQFVRGAVSRRSGLVGKALAALIVRRLAWYAGYLRANQGGRVVSGVDLPSRDLVLHRLWPIAGYWRPRVVDLVLCLATSAPGLFWLSTFLWPRGLFWRAVTVAFVGIWMAMLVRTSTKAWVPTAAPDFSRLLRPAFVLRQAGVSGLIGALAGLLAGPVVGLVALIVAWVAIGLTVGFGQTLTTDAQVTVVGARGVLRREHMVSRLAAWAVFPALTLGFTSTWGVGRGVAASFAYCLVVGETAASAVWRRYLALCLSSPIRLSLRPGHVLDRAVQLGLVRTAGLSYQFRHDGLLDYFSSSPGRPWALIRSGHRDPKALRHRSGSGCGA